MLKMENKCLVLPPHAPVSYSQNVPKLQAYKVVFYCLLKPFFVKIQVFFLRKMLSKMMGVVPSVPSTHEAPVLIKLSTG